MAATGTRARYRFGDFVVSPSQRVLVRSGLEVPLVPRYLDLLLLLIEKRHQAVHRREIFDSVWSDVVVSDGALSQAVRTLRRALGDGPRDPSFIRTVSRHGYQFVYPEVREEDDSGPIATAAARPAAGSEEMRAPLVRSRLAAAAAGGALAGGVAGLLGGLFLALAPGGPGSWRVLAPLTLVGLAIGGIGAAGVGAGLVAAEAIARSGRGLGLVSLGALGGGLTGALAHTFGRWTLEGLFGHELSFVGGGYEGLVVGAGAGLGYTLATRSARGGRARAALVAGLVSALAFVALAHAGGHLGGASLDFMARSFQGSQVGLAPLARLLGEAELGPRTRTVLAAYEGLLFGIGLTLGLTRPPARERPPRS